MNAGTISISIGDGRHGSSIVLPRGHELVRHLEALLPSGVTSGAAKLAPPPAQYMYQDQGSQGGDALTALANASQHACASLPALTRHLHNRSPTASIDLTHANAQHPSSPYHSDSSASSTAHTSEGSSSTGVRRRRAGKACASSGKKCQIPDCDKISVSRGLCRGHGGGRRCQFESCSKGAQSRSDFCWSHGGGQRCEVPNCMRSRKTKRFCVAHINWENASEGTMLPTGEMTPRVMPRVLAPAVPDYVQTPASKLPSLQQALKRHQCSVPVAVPSTMAYPIY